MTGSFEKRVVVVTGATGALGTGVTTALLDAGATCYAPSVNPAELERFPHADHERMHLVPNVDLTDESKVEAFFKAIPDVWALIHIVGGFAMAPIAETSLADFNRMFSMNAATCFLCCREAVKRIRSRTDAADEGGRIVNVAARPALAPTGGMIAYTTSKAAVASITQCLASEVCDERIWVNAVAPSIIDTASNRRAMPDADHARWPSADDVAQTILFLASPANRSTSGVVAPVYGMA